MKCPLCGSKRNKKVRAEDVPYALDRKCKACSAIWRPRRTKSTGILSVVHGLAYVVVGLLVAIFTGVGIVKQWSGLFSGSSGTGATIGFIITCLFFGLGLRYVAEGAQFIRHGFNVLRGFTGDLEVIDSGAKGNPDTEVGANS